MTGKDGHHPIIFMQCGPVRYRVNGQQRAAAHPFEHTVIVRPTGFRPLGPANPDVRVQFHELYEELIADEERNRVAEINSDVGATRGAPEARLLCYRQAERSLLLIPPSFFAAQRDVVAFRER
ncbi:MAG: hypothetical protein ABSE93_19595 [Terriglobia bacterium]|jgi:hypothetical protein